MKTPTKKQVTDRLNHFEEGVSDIIKALTSGDMALEAAFPYLRALVLGAPSLEPVAKAEETEIEAAQ